MKLSRGILTQLNQALSGQLVAINQSFLHARMLKNWGFRALGKEEYDASIQSMRNADKLIERILFLEGLPNLQDLGKLLIGESVPELLTADLRLETSCRAQLVEAVAFCEGENDFVSRDLLTEILEESEERIDFIEIQLERVGKMGLENYLQSAMGTLKD